MAKPAKDGIRIRRPLIELENVVVQFGDRPLLCGIDWVLGRGEHWIVSGPTGSGKSLLGQVLCRHVPLRGAIHYHFDADRAAGRSFVNRGEVVMVSSDAQRALKGASGSYHQARWQSFEGDSSPRVSELLTGESVERISAYDISPLKTPVAEYARRREQIVQSLGMEHLLERRVIHLSNGESRKLLIARALLQEPRVLILDEPLDGLDVESRSRLKRAIETLAGAGSPSLVYLTTRAEEAPAGLDHQLELDRGRVEGIGRRTAPLTTPGEMSTSAAVIGRENPGGLSPVDRIGEGEIVIDIRNASVRYAGVEVLSGCDWVVRRGDHWVVVGPNGAGKSTLLSLILGDNPQAYSNDIRLFGRRRGSGDSIWELKRRIGWVAPELQIYYPLDTTIRAVILSGFFDSIGLFKQPSQEQSDLAAGWEEKLGIAHLAGTALGAASAGEQRLALLARALIKNPELLVLDEPYQGIDLRHRELIAGILEEVGTSAKTTIVFVTHRLEEIPRCVSRRLRLDRGRIVERGPLVS